MPSNKATLNAVRNGTSVAVDAAIRPMTLRAGTVDEESRSIQAVIATADRIANLDLTRWEVVDEILLMRGAEIPDQCVFFDAHPEMWGAPSASAIRGSVREMEIEGKRAMIGRIYFAADQSSDELWGKYRDGHATDVSVGVERIETHRILPGQKQTIGGKVYTAGKRPLHVTTRWRPKEVSAVPWGADPKAKVRHDPLLNSERKPMNPRLLAFLRSIGLRAEASEEEAQRFQTALAGRNAQISNVLESETQSETAGFMARAALRELGVDPDDPTKPLAAAAAGSGSAARAQAPLAASAGSGDAAGGAATQDAATQAPIDADTIRAEERQRFATIRQLAGEDLSDEQINLAVRDGWDEARVARQVLDNIRGGRTASVGAGPAIHSRSHDADCTREALGAAMIVRAGLNPVANFAEYREGCLVPRREGADNSRLEQAADLGFRYRDMSLLDVCREAIRLDGNTPPHSRGEMIRAAVSGSALTSIFTTSVNAQLLSGYQDAADSTVGWTSSSDVPNFQSNERVTMGKFGALQKLARGKTAEHLDESDSKEEYKIARYAGQFVVDEQDIIDDRLGAVGQVSPSDIGSSAAQLRPNLVYALLLANAALSDTGALFNATAETTAGGHANLTTAALAATALEAGIVAMGKHRIRKRPLNVRPRFLIVPQDLRFTASILLRSAERIISSASGGTYNPLANEGIELRMDDRIGVGGVTDPATGTAYAGTATNWFLAGRPGENGAKTIEVGYLRGTGRSPQIRSFVLNQGQWGVGWDINMDIGGKALDYRAMHKSTGAS